MNIITPTEIEPTVRIANYFETVSNAAWGPRTIPDWELILVVSGQFVYETAEAVLPVRTGEVLLIPPEKTHTFRRRCAGEHAVISCIHGEMISEGTWAGGDYRLKPEPQLITRVKNRRLIRTLFKEAEELFAGYARYRDARLKTVVRTIWLTLAEHWQKDCSPRLSLRMEEMIRFLRKHLSAPISRLDLAKKFELTPQHINAIFKKELGISPTQFIHRERVMQAYQYMQIEGLAVHEAAERVGFSDSFYFSKVFKHVMGFPPARC
jgi:AraC-like DNA-binding protein